VQVRWNNVLQRTINLQAAAMSHKQFVKAVALPSVQSGTLRITVTSPTGKMVGLEGVAILRI
jgi:hypothetical protein